MSWFADLEKKKRDIITIAAWVVFVVLAILYSIISHTVIAVIALIVFILSIVFTVFAVKSNKLDKKANEDAKNKIIAEKKEREKEQLLREDYLLLCKNDYDFDADFLNIEISFLIKALQLLKSNKFFKKSDFDFDVDNRIAELEKLSISKVIESNNGDFVSVDIETTGLSADTERIIQIAALKFEKCKLVDKFVTYVNPKKAIPAKASDINGIYDYTVADAPTIKQVFPKFIDFVSGYKLVMHNAHFDYSFIQNEHYRTLRSVFEAEYECTMQLWRNRYQTTFGDYPASAKLIDVSKFLLSKNDYANYYKSQHTADADANITAKIYLKII